MRSRPAAVLCSLAVTTLTGATLLAPAPVASAAATAQAGEQRGDVYLQEVGRQTTQAQRRNADMTRVSVTVDEIAQALIVTAKVANLTDVRDLKAKVHLTTPDGQPHSFHRDLDTGQVVGVSEYDRAFAGYVCEQATFAASARTDTFTYTVPVSCLVRTDPETLDEQGQPVETGRIERARIHVVTADTRTSRDGGFYAVAYDESKQTRMLDLLADQG